MADYVVHFTGKNDLSSEVTKVKKDLEGVSTSANKLDQIKNKFNKIINSVAPLRSQLKGIRDLMALMNFHGLEGDPSYIEMADQIGKIKDALSATDDAIKLFGDGQYKLIAVMNSFEAVAGATSIATGAMSLFGAENENVARAIQKVQSVMAILNGVQAIAKVLDKDSAMMLRIRHIRTLALAAAKDVDTAETTKNTLAMGANTVATTANTAAQKAWNVAKAIAKALLGDWTGWLLLGAVALGGYAIATAGSTKETEKETEATKRAKTAKQQYLEEAASSAGKLIGQYKMLQIQWNNLKTEGEKNQFLKDNISLFKELNDTINSVADAEKFLNEQTNKYIQAIEARAQATAAYNQIIKVWEEHYKRVSAYENSRAGGGYYSEVKAGDKVSKEEFLSAYKHYYGKEFDGSDISVYKFMAQLPQTTAAIVNKFRNDSSIIKKQQLITASYNKALSDTKYLSQIGADAAAKIDKLGDSAKGASDNITYMASNRASRTTNDNERKLDTEKIGDSIVESIKKRNFSNDLSPESLVGLVKANNFNFKGQDVSNAKMKFTDIQSEVEQKLEAINKIQDEFQLKIRQYNQGAIKYKDYQNALQNAENALKLIDPNLIIDKYSGEVKGTEAIQLEQLKSARELVQGLSGDFGTLYTQIDAINTLLHSTTQDSEGNLIPNVNDRNVGTIAATALATQQLGSALQALGAQGAAAKAGLILSAIGQLATSFAAAMLSASKNWITWLAFGATGMGILVSLISQMKSFADGGIIEGNSFHGDKILARVNAGEMILNQKQQSNLYHQLNNRGGLGAGTVKFEIAGSTLKGVLRNYDNKMSKVQ